MRPGRTASLTQGTTGSADTRTLAATEAVDSVLAYWGRRHPRTGGAEIVTVCVEDTDAHVGPGIDQHGCYDPDATTEVLHRVRDHLAQPSTDTEPNAPTGPCVPSELV